MQTSRKAMRGSRVYTVPLFGIVALLACYWVLADWQQLPAIISSAFETLRWPH